MKNNIWFTDLIFKAHFYVLIHFVKVCLHRAKRKCGFKENFFIIITICFQAIIGVYQATQKYVLFQF